MTSLTRSQLRAGQVILIDGLHHKMLRLFGKGTWQVEVQTTREIKTFTHDDLMRLHCLERMTFAEPWRDPKLEVALKKFTWSTDAKNLTAGAKRRLAYVRAVLPFSKTLAVATDVIKQTAASLKDPKPPHASTVLEWRRDYEVSGNNPMSLVDRNSEKGRRSAAMHPELHLAVETAIQTTYLQRTQNSLQHTFDIAQALVAEKNKIATQNGKDDSHLIPLPTFYQVRQQAERIDAYYRDVRRKGRDEAERLHRSTKGHHKVCGPLSSAECDHSTIDVIIVDDRTFIPMGRPTVTVCQETFTRALLGLYVSFDKPSFRSVAHCMKHALLPKLDMKFDGVEITNPWFAYGAMYQLGIDNGQEFHSEEFESLCFANDIDLVYAKRKTGWHKPHIERFIGTMTHDFVQTLPGTTFSHVLAKGDYNSKKNAIMPLGLFKALLVKWVCDVYHVTAHSSTGLSPMSAWENHVSPQDIPLLSAPLNMTSFIGYREPSRIASENGIQHKNLQYNSPALHALRNQHGDKLNVQIRWDSADLGSIFVIHPDEPEPIKVLALDSDYASGLSLYQHERIQTYTRQVMRKEDSKSTRLEAKLAIARIVQAAMERAGRGGTFKTNGLGVKVDVGRYTHGADGTGSGFSDAAKAITNAESTAKLELTRSEPVTAALQLPVAAETAEALPARKKKRFDPIYDGQILTEKSNETLS
jgi:putative transposase